MPVQCERCKMSVPNYNCLAQHYINVHHDHYGANKAGKCKICLDRNPQNIHKLKRYANPEELKTHHDTTHNEADKNEIQIPCKCCDKSFIYYPDLADHYRNEHDKPNTAKYVGVCDLCSMMAELGGSVGGTTPDKVYSTYNALKSHWKSAHWNGMVPKAWELLEKNELSLSRR